MVVATPLPGRKAIAQGVEKLATARGKKAGVIDMRAYGMMDGKAAMAQARQLAAG